MTQQTLNTRPGTAAVRRLSVENFKLFRKLEIPRVGRITLIGGRNNVGKSSLLEAIFMMFDRFNSQVMIRPMAFRNAIDTVHDADSLFGPAFHNFNTDEPIAFEIDNGRSTQRVEFALEHDLRKHRIVMVPEEVSSSSTPDRPKEAGAALEVLHVKYLVDGNVVNTGTLSFNKGQVTLGWEHDREELPPAVFLGSRRNVTSMETAQRFSKLSAEKKTRKLVNVLQRISSTIRDLELLSVGDKPILHADIGLDRLVPVNLLGDGTNRLLSIYLAMGSAANGVVLVDEIDTGFHYSVLPDVWRLLGEASSEFGSQLICTTHSRECLVAAQTALGALIEPDVSYIRLDEVKGQVRAKHYSFDAFEAAIETDKEVR